jgi:hypothetical protein
MKRTSRLAVSFAVLAFVTLVAASPAYAKRCGNKSADSATWLSIAHPGLGEWYLNDWGGFFSNAPQKKFWLGFIPVFGWPGYLQVKSAIDANHCRTNDQIFGS